MRFRVRPWAVSLVGMAFAAPSGAAAPGMATADSLYRAASWSEAAAAYGQLTSMDPGNGRAWFRLGVCRAKSGDHAGAVAAYLKSEAIGHAPEVMYNLACSSAQLADTARAFGWLEKAAAGGFRGADRAREDQDLASLRGSPHFRALLATFEFNQRPCAHLAEYRRLDFWVGDWEVRRTADSSLAGTNLVTLEVGDCAVREQWSAGGAGAGESLSYYDPVTRQWHQSWMDDQGRVSSFDGEWRDGAMRLEGYRTGANGERVPARLTLIPQADGSVRQRGENSADGGITWTVAYDFTYRRRIEPRTGPVHAGSTPG